MSQFSDYALLPEIQQALQKMGFTSPTPVQAATLPIILEGSDLIALAATGSGKTGACAIPLCNQVDLSSNAIQTLVVVPTRELALQYAIEVQKVGKVRGVSAFAIYGGEPADMQLAKLRHKVHVLVATPGRLIDFIHSRDIDLSHVRSLVLDEADEMLSMGFRDDLEFVMQCLVQKHQTLLFSATMPEDIRRIAKQYMQDPKEVQLNTGDKRSPDTIEHQFIYCRRAQDKLTKLQELLREMGKGKGIIFCHTRGEVEKVAGTLRKAKIPGVEYIHAGLSQDMRTSIANKFRQGKVRVLIGTDVLARGLDFTGVTHVYIYQMAENPEIYVHRSGRTGRYESEGVSITLVTDRDFRALKKVMELVKLTPQWIGTPPKGFASSSSPKKKVASPKKERRVEKEPRREPPKKEEGTGKRKVVARRPISILPPPPNLVQVKPKED